MDAHPLICNISAAKIISTSVQALAFHELPFLGFFFFFPRLFRTKAIKKERISSRQSGAREKVSSASVDRTQRH